MSYGYVCALLPLNCFFFIKYMPISTNSFPLSSAAIEAFENLRKDLANSLIVAINTVPLVVEKDASNYVIAATLRQFGHPVAFFSRTMQSKKKPILW